ncbi:MAG: chorismate mutase, partial [Lachnospiraceae bacterium]|nr:chorismate mutase [Lachnospiraceae bacterium]
MMDLREMRVRIDAVDAKIEDLLKERYTIVGEVASYKAANGLPVYDAAREEEKISALRQRTDDKEMADYLEKIIRAV